MPFVFGIVAGLLGALLVVKLFLRPWVVQRTTWVGADIFVFSFPSYVEAVAISALVFVIISAMKRASFPIAEHLSQVFVFVVSVVLTGIYTISQELLAHNTGGENTVDQWDVLASVLGLATMTLLFLRFRFWKENS